VEAVLDGTVQHEGDQVRITAQQRMSDRNLDSSSIRTTAICCPAGHNFGELLHL
jgi:hypothetical protein